MIVAKSAGLFADAGLVVPQPARALAFAFVEELLASAFLAILESIVGLDVDARPVGICRNEISI